MSFNTIKILRPFVLFFNTIKILQPFVLFFAGIAPWIFVLLVDLFFYEFYETADEVLLFSVTMGGILGSPICFLTGLLLSLKLTGKYRRIGLMLNGLGLAAMLSFWAYILLA